MKNTLLLLLFFLSLNDTINAQSMSVTTDSQGRLITTFSARNITWRRGGNSYTNYTLLGSPFLGGTPWHLGTITLDNQTVIPAMLCYDLNNRILYTVDSVANEQPEIKPNSFTFEGAEFISFKTHFLGFTNIEYGNLIYDGTTKLLVKLHKSVGHPNSFHLPNFNEDGVYVDSNNYYVQKKDGEFEHLNLSNRAILAKLVDKKSEISEFIRNRRIDVQNEKDLIVVLRFYDGLFEKQ